MSTIIWPSDIVVEAADYSIEYDVQLNIARSGRIDTYGLPGARWVATITFPDDYETLTRPRIEALVASLRGGARTLSMGHLSRKVPNGTLRGSPTIATQTAKGDNTLSIANAFGTNLFLYPQAFDNAYWIKTRATVTADAAIAPDGTLTADKLVEDTTAANSHALRADNVPTTPGQRYTASVYAQAAERTAIRVLIQEGINTANTVWTNFDLVAGSKGSTFYGGSGADGSAAIESVGSGWYRCSVSGLVAPAATSLDVVVQPIVGGTSLYDGDGTAGLYIWGAQLERGSAASAYSAYATIKAGDLLGVGTELSMADEDANAAADATMTVKVSPAVRNVYTVGTAVVWDKPRILWIPRSNVAGPFPFVGGNLRPGFSLELVERG